MGLTIHYRIEAGRDWTRRQIREKLEDTRQFALSLPVISVSDVVECRRVQSRFDEAVRLAEEAFVAELAKLVSHLTERLSGSEDGQRKVFRDSMVENLTEFFGRFRAERPLQRAARPARGRRPTGDSRCRAAGAEGQ